MPNPYGEMAYKFNTQKVNEKKKNSPPTLIGVNTLLVVGSAA